MFSLLIVTITTSAVDSLNPVAITQQFILQGLVKKRRHICYYIGATAIVNFIVGILVYFGLGALIQNYMNVLLGKYSKLIFASEIILGIIMLIVVGYKLMNTKVKALENKILNLQGQSSEELKEMKNISKGKSLNPVSLFFIGSVATICELPTALPYFAYLAIMLSYELPVTTVILLLLLYNLIYSSPLILLYFIYVKYQDKVDKFYKVIKEKISKYSEILTPIVIVGIGIFLIYHGFFNILK